MKQRVITMILVMLCGINSASSAYAAHAFVPIFHDIKNHYAEGQIEEAIGRGWIDGYGDGTFRPNDYMKRAEFVKLIMTASKLVPGTSTTDFFLENSSWSDTYGYTDDDDDDDTTPNFAAPLQDMQDHWLTQLGYTQIALGYGLIIPEDYWNLHFSPDDNITRYDIAIIAVRILGLVYPAEKESHDVVPLFTDAQEMPEWIWGYITEAANAGVLNGYPDGSFRGNRYATRAEAVTIVSRVMAYMEKGIDEEIRVLVKQNVLDDDGNVVSKYIEEPQIVPVQIIDDVIYAGLDIETYHDVGRWLSHKIALFNDTYPIQSSYTAGSKNELGGSEKYSHKLRILYGVLMIPYLNDENSSVHLDKDKKILWMD